MAGFLSRGFMKTFFSCILLMVCFVKAYSQDIDLITKESAEADIDSLIYAISEVHPNMFAVCRQDEFMKMVSDIKQSLPDSLSAWEMYVRLQPLIVKIGDGHTRLTFPFNDLVNENTPRIPVSMAVTPDNKVKVVFSVGNKIAAESEIVKINGVAIEDMFKKMLCYQSGETEVYKMNGVRESFSSLFLILYSSDTYDIEYFEPERTKTSRAVLKACPNKDVIEWKKNNQPPVFGSDVEPYSFKLIPDKNVAIMDFRSFDNPNFMEVFADSMFTALNRNNINNLIIDVRENGGGNSQVGDIVLAYISDKPFCQFQKYLVRVTPITQNLMQEKMDIGWYYGEIGIEDFVQPKGYEEGHYKGNTILLVSNHTFSSASSFSWAFKEFGMGKVVGEETGGVSVSFGDVLLYKMPYSGLTASVSFKKFWHYNADENHIHGTIPDYCVAKENALSKALELCDILK